MGERRAGDSRIGTALSPACPRCGYDAGVQGRRRCPECGEWFEAAGEQEKEIRGLARALVLGNATGLVPAALAWCMRANRLEAPPPLVLLTGVGLIAIVTISFWRFVQRGETGRAVWLRAILVMAPWVWSVAWTGLIVLFAVSTRR